MRIFADNCIHTDIIRALISAGFEVERAIDKGLADASDREIFKHIIKSSQILLTFDKDFGNIIRFNIEDSKGVVIIYVENMNRKEIIYRVVNFFQNITERKLKGSLFIIEPQRIRIWHH